MNAHINLQRIILIYILLSSTTSISWFDPAVLSIPDDFSTIWTPILDSSQSPEEVIHIPFKLVSFYDELLEASVVHCNLFTQIPL